MYDEVLFMINIKQLMEQKRNHLELLIQKKDGDLSDSEIIAISQELDTIINMYNKATEDKNTETD